MVMDENVNVRLSQKIAVIN